MVIAGVAMILLVAISRVARAQEIPAGYVSVGNLVIPESTIAGDTAQITVDVTNNWNQRGKATISLGGDFMVQQQVTLQPNETKTLTFDVTPVEEGLYQIAVDGLSGQLTVLAAPEPNIHVVMGSLVIDPSTIYLGQSTVVRVDVTNDGDAAGSKVITLDVIPI